MHDSPASSARRALTLLAAAGLSAVALGACGGGADAAPTGASDANDRDTARLKLTQCLRENGVDVPDGPGPGAGGGQFSDADREKRRAAIDGPCKKLREAAVGEISAADRQEFQDAFAKFAQCMRDHGVEVPDIGAGGPPRAGLRGLDRDDPKVQAAREACQSTLPRRGAGGRGGLGGGAPAQ